MTTLWEEYQKMIAEDKGFPGLVEKIAQISKAVQAMPKSEDTNRIVASLDRVTAALQGIGSQGASKNDIAAALVEIRRIADAIVNRPKPREVTGLEVVRDKEHITKILLLRD